MKNAPALAQQKSTVKAVLFLLPFSQRRREHDRSYEEPEARPGEMGADPPAETPRRKGYDFLTLYGIIYQDISDEKDAAAFLAEANGLHDGYIVSVDYQHHGYTWGNPLFIDPEKTKLVLRVMITSINNTLIEIVFEGIKEFQIKDEEYGLFDSSISFSKDGVITWCGNLSTDPDDLRGSTYVVAGTMKWRFVLP